MGMYVYVCTLCVRLGVCRGLRWGVVPSYLRAEEFRKREMNNYPPHPPTIPPSFI